MHVLVVTHLLGCVEMEMVALFLCLYNGRLNPGLVPRPETPGFPSKIRLPSSTNTIPVPVARIYRPFKVIQGNNVTLAHSGEPYMQQKMGKIVETLIPRTRTCVEDAAPQNPLPHL